MPGGNFKTSPNHRSICLLASLQLIFLEGNLNATKYLRIVREVYVPFLRTHPDTRHAFEQGWLTWQQDGAGCHTADRVSHAIYVQPISPH